MCFCVPVRWKVFYFLQVHINEGWWYSMIHENNRQWSLLEWRAVSLKLYLFHIFRDSFSPTLSVSQLEEILFRCIVCVCGWCELINSLISPHTYSTFQWGMLGDVPFQWHCNSEKACGWSGNVQYHSSSGNNANYKLTVSFPECTVKPHT